MPRAADEPDCRGCAGRRRGSGRSDARRIEEAAPVQSLLQQVPADGPDRGGDALGGVVEHAGLTMTTLAVEAPPAVANVMTRNT